MSNKINIKGLITVVVLLAAFHLATGFLISPLVAQALVKNLNETSDLRLSVEKVNFWPLTLSLEVKNLKVFDPADTGRRLLLVAQARAHLSFLQLLAKRLVLEQAKVDGLRFAMAGEPDASFHMPTAGSRKTNLDLGLTFNKWKADWGQNKEEMIAKVQKFLKEDCSKEKLDKYKLRFKQAKAVAQKSVKKKLKGRIVEFKTPADSGLVELRAVGLENAYLSMQDQQNNTLAIDQGKIQASGVVYDPELGGLAYDSLVVAARIKASGAVAGSLRMKSVNKLEADKRRSEYDFTFQGLDLAALRFFYQSVLPVNLQKGKLDLESRTVFLDDALDSQNSLTLRDHSFGGQEYAKVLDKINPLALSFKVGGTVFSPDFKDLDSSFNKLLQQNAKEVIKETVKEEASKALDKYIDKDKGSSDASGVVDSLGGLFKK